MAKKFNAADMLADLDGGLFLEKLSEALALTGNSVADNGDKRKQGVVTLEFKMTRIGESCQVEMAHKLKYQRPTRNGRAWEENTTTTALYVIPGGGLSILPTSGDLFTGTTPKSTAA